jgi:hypothetical protein
MISIRRLFGWILIGEVGEMAYAFTQDVPIDAAFYARITDELGDEPPPGLIVHLAVEKPGGGLRYYSVWESEEDCDRFGEERLHPVVHKLLRKVFGDDLPPEPARDPLPVIHVWGQATGVTVTKR